MLFKNRPTTIAATFSFIIAIIILSFCIFYVNSDISVPNNKLSSTSSLNSHNKFTDNSYNAKDHNYNNSNNNGDDDNNDSSNESNNDDYDSDSNINYNYSNNEGDSRIEIKTPKQVLPPPHIIFILADDLVSFK